MNYFATYPHYRRHMQPIIDALGIEAGVGPVTMVASRSDAEKVARVNGTRVIVVEHGAGQFYQTRDIVKDGGYTLPQPYVDLYLGPNQQTCDRMADAFPEAQRVAVGSPALEAMTRIERQPSRPAFAVHWPSPLGPDEAKTSWPWSANILKAMLKMWPDTLMHCHPKMTYRFQRDLQRRRLVGEFSAEWSEVWRQATFLLVDNSSIIWEAAATGLPVILIDPPHWNRYAPHGLRFGEEGEALEHIASPDDLSTMDISYRPVNIYAHIEGATARAVDAIRHYLTGRDH